MTRYVKFWLENFDYLVCGIKTFQVLQNTCKHGFDLAFVVQTNN